MNLKTFCLFFFLISFLAFSPEVMAEEGTSSDDALSPSTIFDPSPESVLKPRSNIGKMLKNNGFKQQSVKEEKDGFTYFDGIKSKHYPSYIKTFTKGAYTVRYRYAFYDDGDKKDQLSFDSVEIRFPSKSAMNRFMESLKASLKRKGHVISTDPDYPNWYWVGREDVNSSFERTDYDIYKIKGTTVTFEETKGMNPHEIFD